MAHRALGSRRARGAAAGAGAVVVRRGDDRLAGVRGRRAPPQAAAADVSVRAHTPRARAAARGAGADARDAAAGARGGGRGAVARVAARPAGADGGGDLARERWAWRACSAGDNFFDLGGTSLIAVKIRACVRERLGVTTPVHALLEHPRFDDFVTSLRELLGGQTEGRRRSLLVPLRPGRPGTRPLFLVQPIGGTVYTYLPLARHLDAGGAAIFGVRASGTDPGEPVLDEVPTMAGALRRGHPARTTQSGHTPSAAHSAGGITAYEVARQARGPRPRGPGADPRRAVDAGGVRRRDRDDRRLHAQPRGVRHQRVGVVPELRGGAGDGPGAAADRAGDVPGRAALQAAADRGGGGVLRGQRATRRPRYTRGCTGSTWRRGRSRCTARPAITSR